MCHKSLLIACVLFLANLYFTDGSQAPPSSEGKLNAPAPELGLERLLQSPAEAKTDWKSLQGKVVVLEFWATWCAPCIAAIPHLNDLADRLQDQPLEFIAITDESESTVIPFLKRRPMKAWVGLDSDRSVFEAYDVQEIPYTVVVDRDGKIAAFTKPESLTEKMLRGILQGKLPNPVEERSDVSATAPSQPPKENDIPPRLSLTITPTKSEGAFWSRGSGKFEARGIDLKTLISLLYKVTKTRVIGSPLLEDARYEILASLPEGDKSDLESTLARIIEASFRLKIRREMQEAGAFVLSVPDQTALRLKPNPAQFSRSSNATGVIAAFAAPIEELVKELEGVSARM
jgi:thiol-disulfide isomerase/thioredoxin